MCLQLFTVRPFWPFPCFYFGEASCGRRKKRLRRIQTFVNLVIESAKVHSGKIAVLAVSFLLQFVFVRELLAAELLFGIGIAVVMVPGVPAYAFGPVGALCFQRPRRCQ